MDAACVQGTPFVFSMGATTIEGRKRMQGFAESTLYNRDALERMLQHLIALGTGRGLGCGDAGVTGALHGPAGALWNIS